MAGVRGGTEGRKEQTRRRFRRVSSKKGEKGRREDGGGGTWKGVCVLKTLARVTMNGWYRMGKNSKEIVSGRKGKT